MALTKIVRQGIADDAIDGTKIADDVVNSEHIVDAGIDSAHINDVAASKLTGTIASGRLSAANLGSGTVPTARLGSGTADNTKFLRGDNTWQVVDTSGKLNLSGGTMTGGITSSSDITVGSAYISNNYSSFPGLRVPNNGYIGCAAATSMIQFQGTGIFHVPGATTMGGDLTVDTNTLFVDASTNRVGIGTSSPGYKLTIKDSNADGAHLSLRNEVTDGREYRLGSMGASSGPGVGAFAIYQNTYNGTGGGTNGDFYALTILEDGKVGIGTVSPTSELDVTGLMQATRSGTGLTIRGTGTGSSDYSGIGFKVQDTSSTWWTSGALNVTKEQSWTSTASTRDSKMTLRVIKDDAWVDALTLRADGRMLGKVILNSESGSGRWANSGVWHTIQDLSSHPGGTMYLCEAAIQSLGGYTGTMLVYKSNNTQYHVIKITNTSGEMRMSGSNVQYRQGSGADQTNTSGFQRVQVVASIGSHG